MTNTLEITLMPTDSSSAEVPPQSHNAVVPALMRFAGASSDTTPAAELVSQEASVVRVITGQAWVAGHELARPVRVSISSHEADVWVVEESSTGIFGSGLDVAAAVMDFRQALVEHRDVLEAAESLSADLRDQLTFLKSHLRAA